MRLSSDHDLLADSPDRIAVAAVREQDTPVLGGKVLQVSAGPHMKRQSQSPWPASLSLQCSLTDLAGDSRQHSLLRDERVS